MYNNPYFIRPRSVHNLRNMNKTRIKVSFFESEITCILDLQQQLQEIRVKLKEAIMQATSKNINYKLQTRIIEEANFRCCCLIKEIQEEIKTVKIKSDLFCDQGRYQGEVFFKSMQEKVEDLNQRLFQAEQGVQRAQNIKKSLDLIKSEYQMNNIVNFRYAPKANVLNGYIEVQNKIKNQFKRAIVLMMRANDKVSKNYSISQFQRHLNMRANKIRFNQMKRQQNNGISQRKSKSEEKAIIIETNSQLRRQKKQPLIGILLKSSSIRYKNYRELALQQLLTKLRENNKKSTLTNKLLKKGLQLRNRNEVLKYLQSKQVLTEQESLMKIQLMSDKLNEFMEEKMLSLKQGKKSKQFDQGMHRAEMQAGIKRKTSKSMEKFEVKPQKQFKLRKSTTKVNLKKQFFEQFGSFASNPKTNDSIN